VPVEVVMAIEVVHQDRLEAGPSSSTDCFKWDSFIPSAGSDAMISVIEDIDKVRIEDTLAS
jgi:hypothetical protein